MALTTTTTFMSMILPVVGQQIGPTWAQELDDAFTTLDSHDHSAGKGTPVTPAGLNVTSDLSMKGTGTTGNNLTFTRTVRFDPQAGTLTAVGERREVYVFGNELYYTDGTGVAVRMTLNGAVDTSGSGNITGMGGTTAGVAYSNATKTFTFIQAAAVSAHLDVGKVTLRDTAASANGLVLIAPAGIVTTYNLTFPTALPAAVNTTLWTVTDTGQIAFSLAPVLTARPTFAGVNPGNTADTTAGNVRWSGTFFEGYRNGAFRGLEGWEWLASTKLGAPALTTGAIAIAARDLLMIAVEVIGTPTSIAFRFNADSAANYYSRSLDVAGGATAITNTARASDTALRIVVSGAILDTYVGIFTIMNTAAKTKALVGSYSVPTSSVATQDTSNVSTQGKWGNTAAQITSVELLADSGATNMGIGSGFVVFGKILS